MTSESQKPAVVIVGAGPSGLAMAIELGTRSIPCLVVEQGTRAGHAPRAKTTHTRTREHLRRWGIADKLAAASPFGIEYPSNVLFVTRMNGRLLKRFENAFNCHPARNEFYSEHAQWVPQYKLEAVLREHAQSLPGVEVRFGQEFVGYSQDGETVSVDIKDVESGEIRSIEAQYLIGADGARSRARELIGAKMEGQYGLSHHLNIIFRAPGLREANPHGDAIMIWQLNAEIPSILGPMDQNDTWYFGPHIAPDQTFEEEELVEMIQRATGFDVPIEILSSDRWVASTLIADKYRDGRVFLVGDACHLHPPFGGYGMNMGVADSVDLGWKIAATLQGWGGPALLDSYEPERNQVHDFVVREAAENHSVLPRHLIADLMEKLDLDTPEGEMMRANIGSVIEATKRAEFYSLGVSLGYRYGTSPVIAYEADDDWKWSRDYTPASVPGCRAPHAWLDDDTSLFDTFGSGFTLLAKAGVPADILEAAKRDAEALGIPLKVVVLEASHAAGLYDRELTLIRPDQHIAWRGNHWQADALRKVAGFAADGQGETLQARSG